MCKRLVIGYVNMLELVARNTESVFASAMVRVWTLAMNNADSLRDDLQKVFDVNFKERGEIGASVSVWKNGTEIAQISGGYTDKSRKTAWSAETIVPFYSATKGLAAATVLLCLERAGLTPESRVSQVWPSFPAASATFAEMLSHQCGLAALDRRVSVWDHAEVIGGIEAQELNWTNGHGYHPRTYGFLLDEIVRRLEGETLGEVFRSGIAEPLDLDLWIGLPESEFGRVATLYPGKMNKEDLSSGFYQAFNKEGTLVRRAFSSPRGLQSVQEMNTPKAWQASLPAMGGIGSARGLAGFYQAVLGHLPCFPDDVREWMTNVQVTGDDQILLTPTQFTCGFQMDPVDATGQKLRYNYGASLSAFGHPGAGGSHAFADPESGLSFSYVMNQMELSVLPNSKTIDLVRTVL